ncbi:YebC/PmpR family DNA-binding transcriptional regulator [Pueribacillus theae]|uniref:Probable transcriptional regulatory protein DCC39_10585 n=1 Tax=Pueribacillus theae TaxID=2171751 RepID=A0A2U1K190_9BACI|nr:YebC/PmpR family DNA-binding transcriptional regulator [Pueribacillus theae]PWA10728.1 YebC/PmpR family DNA-binding transcriptional regulator [Pueribacillus theae]
MAGHSKWKNIQHRKNTQDAKRGKIFMKLAREIYVAAKNGGGDPETNSALRLVIEKARTHNMPNDNIERAIQKATGGQDDTQYDEITYEGYGPGGIAVMVKVLTDNRNRSAAEVRHAFTKNGGNLGENGCVAFMFERKGLLMIDKNVEADEEEIMLQAIEAGADEVESEENGMIIYTEPDHLESVKEALEAEGIQFVTSEVTMIPQTTTTPSEEDAMKMQKLIDMLEDYDDVQDVYHNMD